MGSIIKLGATLAALGTVSLVAYLSGRYWVTRRRERQMIRAREDFLRRREWLEAQFLTAASARGLPRGLNWANCDFANPVAFARDRKNGELTALVAVTIWFTATEGGEMEDVEAVADAKSATAVFRHDGHQWTTEGRAVFNLNPKETIKFYQGELETVD